MSLPSLVFSITMYGKDWFAQCQDNMIGYWGHCVGWSSFHSGAAQ